MNKSLKKIKKKLDKIEKKYGLDEAVLKLGDWEENDDFCTFVEWEPDILPEAPAVYTHELMPVSPAQDVTDRGAKRINRIAQQLLDEEFVIVHGDKVYVYKSVDGAYHDISGKKFHSFLEQRLSERDCNALTSRTIDEVEKAVLRKASTTDQSNHFNTDASKLHCSNGIVSVDSESVSLLPHSPDIPFNYTIRANYIESMTPEQLYAKCPAFQKYVGTTFADDVLGKTRQLLEAIGYLLCDSIKGKCAIAFIGAANSGKSVMGAFITELLGKEAIANVPIHRLDDQFYRAQLHNVKLAITTETSGKPFKGVDSFKIVTSGDPVSAAYKGKDVFWFVVGAHIFIIGNVLPVPDESDPSDGYYNRLVVLHFSNGIPKSEQDPYLLDNLWAERDYIFTLAVHAFANLHRSNYQFYMAEGSKRFLENYKSGADSVKSYIADCLEAYEGEKVFVSDVLDNYELYCKGNGLDKKSKSELRQGIMQAFPYATNKRARIGDENKATWHNIRIK